MILNAAVLFILFPAAFAAANKPQSRYTVFFNYDIRHADENFYANRLEVILNRELNYAVALRLMPFVEARHSVERRKRERLTAGLEIGAQFMGYFYIGEELREVWRSEPVYHRGVIANTFMPESLSILKLSFPLIPRINITGYISGEYTYDFRLGRGSRVESLAGFILPIGKAFELNLNWRHRDRISADDCDTLESGITYNF